MEEKCFSQSFQNNVPAMQSFLLAWSSDMKLLKVNVACYEADVTRSLSCVIKDMYQEEFAKISYEKAQGRMKVVMY